MWSRIKFHQSSHPQSFCKEPGVNSSVFQATGHPSGILSLAIEGDHSQYESKEERYSEMSLPR